MDYNACVLFLDSLKRTEESFELDYIGCENWTILVTLGLFLCAAYEKNSVFVLVN